MKQSIHTESTYNSALDYLEEQVFLKKNYKEPKRL
jgi:hypothetical protein